MSSWVEGMVKVKVGGGSMAGGVGRCGGCGRGLVAWCAVCAVSLALGKGIISWRRRLGGLVFCTLNPKRSVLGLWYKIRGLTTTNKVDLIILVRIEESFRHRRSR